MNDAVLKTLIGSVFSALLFGAIIFLVIYPEVFLILFIVTLFLVLSFVIGTVIVENVRMHGKEKLKATVREWREGD